MNACAGDLSDGVEPSQGGAAVEVDQDAPATVVEGRDDGNRRAGDVDAVLETGLVDVGETLPRVYREVREVQENIGVVVLEHLFVDGTGDDIPGGQVLERGVVLHEGSPSLGLQYGSLSADSLGDEEVVLHVGGVEGGGVKLGVLHVEDLGPSPVGHGVAVSTGAGGVRGVEEGSTQAAGGQNRGAGEEGDHLSLGPQEGVGSENLGLLVGPKRVCGVVVRRDQVDRNGPLEEVDVRVLADLLVEGLFDSPSGLVFGEEDPPSGVVPFLGVEELPPLVCGEGDLDLLQEERFDDLRSLGDELLDRRGVGDAVSGGEDILGQQLLRIRGPQGDDSPLGVEGVPLPGILLLGENGDVDARFS